MKIRELTERYRNSWEFKKLSPSTKYLYESALILWARGTDHELSKIKKADILHHVSGVTSNSSIRNYLIATHRLFSFAVSHGYLEHNPASGLKKPKIGEAKRWPDDAIEKFRREGREWAVKVLNIALSTGLRASDLVKVNSANAVDGVLEIEQTKTGWSVWIPIDEDINLTGYSGRNLTSNFSKETKRLGLRGYTLHGLRKTFACKAAESGATSEEIAAALGHKTITMASFYAKEANKRQLSLQAHGKINRAAQ